jgi:hypothetical protein
VTNTVLPRFFSRSSVTLSVTRGDKRGDIRDKADDFVGRPFGVRQKDGGKKMEEEWVQKETKATKSGDRCTASAAEDAEDFDGIAAVDAGGEGCVAFDDCPAAILNDADVECDGGMQPRKNARNARSE